MVDWVRVSKGTQEALRTKRGLPVMEAFAELVPKTPEDAAMAIALPAGMGASGKLLGTLGKRVLSAAQEGGVYKAAKVAHASGAGDKYIARLRDLFKDMLRSESLNKEEAKVLRDAAQGAQEALYGMDTATTGPKGWTKIQELRGGRF